MRKGLKGILIVLICYFFIVPAHILAQSSNTGLCGLFPCDQYTGDSLNMDWGMLIKYALSAVFTVIIVIGIFSVVRAALKIIQSSGEAKQLEEGANMLRGVWIGIAVIFLGIIGIIIVLTIFNAQSILTPNLVVPSGINVN